MPSQDTHDAHDAPQRFRTIRVEMPFDFRSQRFAEDARLLAVQTGRSLESCRQALFLAEGDVREARAVLEHADQPYGGYSALQ